MSNPLIANISLLFSDSPMPERFQRAADKGFTQVEIQFPYEWPAEQLKYWADTAGVGIYLINIPAGDLLNGGLGLSCHHALQADFMQGCAQAIEYGNVLGVKRINVLAGCLSHTDDYDACIAMYIENIRYAAELMLHEGIQVTFEAINHIDMPGYLVSRFDQMKAVYDAVAHPNALMQYDIYHMAMMGEPVSDHIRDYASEIGHIQFADAPGRGAPGTGALPLGEILQLIDKSAYAGAVAAEYQVSGDDNLDYGWLRLPE
ncbi:TIM barrel protein [Oceanospirillum linum]|uniref:Xylose isomerase-like TIM barrel domain-containing protein n=1 Tax=Oceanospirillum linum TaxID=966 RepID=A0A1T1HAF9_OCELI|nr:TIM barrel protein [Oceanospirillum linum]OOV86812.1 hypothetical protein BTA35_0210960 [Oceanospirillum linum]SEG21774.1 hydroxypyruvate isomerase [Oleiphilus messinensis]SMP25158.1 hydroxypyruvate isomerase [Oceanospirillum linum]